MKNNNSESPQSDQLPRAGSVLHGIFQTGQKRDAKTLKRLKRVNKYFMVPFYRLRILPLFFMGRIFVLLITKGRKTGKTRRTPLEYHRIDNAIHIIASRGEKTDWVYNIRAHPDDVRVQVGFRSHLMRPEILNKSECEEFFRWYCMNRPKLASRFIGWDVDRDDPRTTDFSTITDHIFVVRLNKM